MKERKEDRHLECSSGHTHQRARVEDGSVLVSLD